MRRLVLEFPKEELGKIESDTHLLQKLKTFQVLLELSHAGGEVTVICRVEPENEINNFAEYIKNFDSNQIKIIEKAVDGSYIALAKHRITQGYPFGKKGAYVVSREIQEGRFKMTILGNDKQIEDIHKLLQKSGIRYKTLALTDPKFSSDSPLNALTERQKKILISSYRSGYYDVPRRITTEQLSKKLKLHKSALAAHRRKAEYRLLREILKE